VSRHKLLAIVITFGMVFAYSIAGMALSASRPAGPASKSRPAPQQSHASDAGAIQVDDLERSIRMNTYRILADSGPGRGENIYYFKCWMCHNKYTLAENPGVPLGNLYKRSTLLSGDPVTDENVAAAIKNGNPLMPSFRTSLSDSDIADVIAYLKTPKCCWEGEDPPLNPWYHAETNKWPVQNALTGGARGVVKIASGDPAEGIMVQLVAPNGVRTTVYTNDEGKYEFPKMQAGAYILRIANPLELKPYRRDGVRIDGATQLEEILLERVSKTEDLPATPEIEAQMSGAELLWNLTGTNQEKRIFVGCNCHSWSQILRNRYDQRSWNVLAHRMLHGEGATLIHQRPGPPTPNELIVRDWLARVRAPESKDPVLRPFPRPQGAATRVVVTEYELPRVLLHAHDVAGDAQGNIWYSSHKTDNVGRLDPRTGIVTQWTLPLVPGFMPGTHRVAVDKNGVAWFSENWAKTLASVDPKTGEITQVKVEGKPGFGNFALAPDGFIWFNETHQIEKIDPHTGKIVKTYPMYTNDSYDNFLSPDGKFWAGGTNNGPTANSAEMLNIETGEKLEVNTGIQIDNARRGGFDPDGNPWYGGGITGALIELDVKARRIRQFYPPGPGEPYRQFYEAQPDKNGEVWAGNQVGRSFVRFNPKTGRWIEYVMPEPYSFDRRTWIDNSTNPVTIWYVDNSGGYITRIQPFE